MTLSRVIGNHVNYHLKGYAMRSAVTALLCSFIVSGCMFRDVREQQEMLDATCGIEGTVESGANRKLQSVLIVLLAAEQEGSGAVSTLARIEDYFVVERGGRWGFLVGPGR